MRARFAGSGPWAARDGRVGATLVRLGILGLVGCLTLLGPHASGTWLQLAELAGVAAGLTALEWGMLRRVGRNVELSAHYLGDVALLTAALSLGGAQREQFAPLYLLVVAAAGSGVGLGAGLACGTLSALAYPLTLWLTHVPGSLEGVDWARATVLSLVFLSVGTLAGMLAEQARAHRAALEDVQVRLRRMQLDTECIVRNMSSGLLTVDAEGRIGICNPAAQDILGLAGGESSGHSLEEALAAGLAPFAALVEAAIRRGEVHQRAEVEIERADGSRLPLGVSTSVLRESDGRRRGAVAVFQDLTEARELARRARRQETLAAIGELAASVAHEIRNCLNPITGCIEMLRGEASLQGESQRLMDLITREGQRLNQFIGELLEFARMEELHPGPMDLALILEEVAHLLECHPRRTAAHQVSCEAAGPCLLLADGEQLKRVFVNLGVNALEAMPQGGRLAIRLSREPLGRTGTELVITFEDEGHGIRRDHLPQVFEPFFTTKPDGTGLGLSLARQVVERHGGRLGAQNRVERGACLKVSLPADRLDAERLKAA